MYFRVADWLKAIFLILLIIAIYIFIGAISHTIILFIFAALIVFIISPIISFLTSRKVNRIIAIILTYLLFLATLTVLVLVFGPIVVDQVSDFFSSIPQYARSLQRFANIIQDQINQIPFVGQISFSSTALINQATNLAVGQLRNLIALIPSLIGTVADILLVLLISVYLLFYLPQLNDLIRASLPGRIGGVYIRFLTTMRSALGRYFLGQLALMAAVGVLSGIGVWLIGLPFSLLLGIWAGLTELVPILGPVLGAIPAIIIALTIEPILALWVILIFVVVQQLESSVLGPMIFKGTAGLNPLLVIFAIVAGAEVAGILGIFLAVPVLVVFAALAGFIRDNFGYEAVEGGTDRVVVKDDDQGKL